MITGSCQLFFKKYSLEVGGNDCTGKEQGEDQVQIPGIHVRAGFGAAPLWLPRCLGGRDKCLLLARPSEIPSSRLSESPVPKEQNGRWSRETLEVGLSQAHVQVSTPKHTHTHPCIQHIHTNTIPLEALKKCNQYLLENEWNGKLLC